MKEILTSYYVLIIGLAISLIWYISFQLRKPRRYNDLVRYAKEFKSSAGCNLAFKFCEDGMHIMNYYSIPPHMVGYSNMNEFQDEAISALERTHNDISAEYTAMFRSGKRNEDVRELNDKLLAIRADIVRLRMLRFGPNYRKKISGTFSTE